MSWNATIDSGSVPPASFPPQPVQPQTGTFPPAAGSADRYDSSRAGTLSDVEGRRGGSFMHECRRTGKFSGASWSQNLTWTGSGQGCAVNILPMPGSPDTYDILTLTFIEKGQQLSGQNRKNSRILSGG